jgi:hypothetical protein
MRRETEKQFLRSLLFISVALWPQLFRKKPRQHWILLYGYNAVTNVILDKIMVTRGKVEYPTRLLPNLFKIHILFDVILYPTATVIYHQWTKRDKIPAILSKLLVFSVSLTLIEIYADKHTGLIKWRNGWKWYHSFISVYLKSLTTRLAVYLFQRYRTGKR